MHISKQPLNQIKSFRSEFSNIDVFSKLQSNFLQKFFKYNISDYFQQYFANLYESVLENQMGTKRGEVRKEDGGKLGKLERYLASSLFRVERRVTIEELEINIERFYRQRSVSISKNQLPFSFKLKYCNCYESTTPNLLNPKQLIFMDIKIKAEIQQIQQLPQKIIKNFQAFRLQKKSNRTQLQKYLAEYGSCSENFNIFVVYFGDANFQIFNKKNYKETKIKIMGRFYKLKIYVFFVSKQALIETFKSINKISNLQYINDLVIQFYELKRQKNRRKNKNKTIIGEIEDEVQEGNQMKDVRDVKKKTVNRNQNGENDKVMERVYMFVGVFGLVGFGFAIKKLFL